MATFTCSAALPGVQPKGYQTGVQSKTFSHAATASAAAGDVILGCKIPNGATVLDCAIRIGTKANESTMSVFLAKVGDGSTTAIAVMASQSLSSTTVTSLLVRAGTGVAAQTWVPTHISISDDAGIQYAMLKIGVSASSTTTSFSLNGFVTYTMDEPA